MFYNPSALINFIHLRESSPSKDKAKIGFKLQRLIANANKFTFFAYEAFLAIFFPKPKLRILFSAKAEREHAIRKSFSLLHHQIEFKDFTPENIKKNDLIVPLNMKDLRELIKVPELVKNNPIPIPSLESVDICDDKYLFYTTLTVKGFEYLMPKVGKGLSLPYMAKKKVADSGNNCYAITSPEKEKEFECQINDPDYFCQEIVQGTREYATHILFKDHKVVCSINVKYVFANGTFVKGKDKFICTKIEKCPHLETFAAIMDAIGFEGLCCFNYKEVDGKPYVFEINPRFGGSLSGFFFSFIRKLEQVKT
jgi:predicted ATP-grasp superfamily ATP-dependent carboligase